MNYISICSGIEAATLAFHPLGWNPIAFSEIDPFPCAVLKHHYSGVPNLGDMSKYLEWPEELLAQCDLLVGGCPCQAFSVAGLRNSLGDERGNLTLIYVHLINHIDAIRKKHGKPPVISLYENVPGILNTKDNAFGCLVGALCGQDEAPETETGKWPTVGVLWGKERRVGYRILDAQYFGVAQRRRRVFVVAVPNQLVGDFGNGVCPSEILAIPESLRGDTAPSRKAGENVAPTVTGGAPFNRTGNARAECGAYIVGRPDIENEQPIICLQGNMIGRGLKAGPNGPGFSDSGECFTLTKTDVHAVAFSAGNSAKAFTQNTRDEVRYINGDGLIAGALSSQPGMKQTTYLAFNINAQPDQMRFDQELSIPFTTPQYSGVAYGLDEEQNGVEELFGCLKARRNGGGFEGAVAQGYQVRRLTPVECARLQGFPDTYLDIQFKGKPATDSPKYKVLGNSMAVPVMAWLGRRIQAAFAPALDIDAIC